MANTEDVVQEIDINQQESGTTQQQDVMETLENNDNECTDCKSNANVELLIEKGISPTVAEKFCEQIDKQRLSCDDIDSKVLSALGQLSDKGQVACIEEYDATDISKVVNRSALLFNLLQKNKEKFKKENKARALGPCEEVIQEIINRTGYKHEVTSGQRKYGPPQDVDPNDIPQGTELFIGRVPKDVYEDTLIPVFEKIGKIWDMRIMIDPNSGYTRGYCFVTYFEKADAAEAVRQLDGYEIKPGNKLIVNQSVANIRLFVGNIPKHKDKEEIKTELMKLVDGISEVIVQPPIETTGSRKNRGFCFIDFVSQRSAAVAKKKLGNVRTKLFGRDIAVEWGDPDDEPDEETMAKVKALYVKNLGESLSENDVKDAFMPYGTVERVRKVRDYAFVHFATREDAVNAMEAMQGKEIGAQTVEINFAKPPSEKKKLALQRRMERKRNSYSAYNSGDMINYSLSRGRRMNSRGILNDPHLFRTVSEFDHLSSYRALDPIFPRLALGELEALAPKDRRRRFSPHYEGSREKKSKYMRNSMDTRTSASDRAGSDRWYRDRDHY